jgi:hypothetical protein
MMKAFVSADTKAFFIEKKIIRGINPAIQLSNSKL